MAVEIHGEADLRMSEQLHHNAGGELLSEQESCAGMSEVVEPQAPDARGPRELLQVLGHQSPVQRATSRRRETRSPSSH